MSDKLPQESQNEEVDLGQLFNAIGKLFERFFSFIGKIFIGLFSIIIYALKPLVKYFKLVAIVIMIAVIAGYALDKYKKPVYASSMSVKPYFDSKYQLNNSINYFNSLIESENFNRLSTIFEIDTVMAEKLVGFDIEKGPETQKELLEEYNEYLTSIDTTLTENFTYGNFIENRDFIASNTFTITATSLSNDIFPNLEKGFTKILENDYAKKLKEKAEEVWKLQRRSYETELNRIDSIQRIYLDIKTKESENQNSAIGISGLLPLTQEKSQTKEYELFQEELKIRNSLRYLEARIIDENEYYYILSGFGEVGEIQSNFYTKYTLFFPVLALLIMIGIFLFFKIFKFIKEYE